jgi:hypothetical protein
MLMSGSLVSMNVIRPTAPGDTGRVRAAPCRVVQVFDTATVKSATVVRSQKTVGSLTVRVSISRTTNGRLGPRLASIDRPARSLTSERKVTMSIESDAKQDLSLTDEDAESVAGGRANKKAKSKSKTQHHSTPAFTSYVVQGSPPAPGSDPGTAPGDSQAELDSDPDC